MSDPSFQNRYQIGNAFEQRCFMHYPFLERWANDTTSAYIHQSSLERQKPDYRFLTTTGEWQYIEIKSGSVDQRRWTYYDPNLLILFQDRQKHLHASYKRDITLSEWYLSLSGDGSYYAWITGWKEVSLIDLVKSKSI